MAISQLATSEDSGCRDSARCEDSLEIDSTSRALVDGSSGVVGVFDSHGIIIRASPGAAALTGLAPEDLIGRDQFALLPLEMREPLRRVLRGEALVTEHSYTDLGAFAPITLRAEWRPIIADDGRVLGGVLIAEDVTRPDGTARFHDVAEVLSASVAQVALEGTLLYPSPGFARLFGYGSPDEMLAALDGRAPDGLYADPGERKAILTAALEAEGAWVSRSLRLRRKDGTTFSSIVHVCLRHDETRKEPYFFSVVQDVTEEEQARRNLSTLTQILEGAERLAHLGGWEWDLRTDVVHASKEWQRIHGVAEDEIPMAEICARIDHPEDADRIQYAMEQVRTLGGGATRSSTASCARIPARFVTSPATRSL